MPTENGYVYKISTFNYEGGVDIWATCKQPVTHAQLVEDVCVVLGKCLKHDFVERGNWAVLYFSIESSMYSNKFKKELAKRGYTLLIPDDTFGVSDFYPFGPRRSMAPDKEAMNPDALAVYDYLHAKFPQYVTEAKKAKRNLLRSDKRLAARYEKEH